jgi:hypothetical protein
MSKEYDAHVEQVKDGTLPVDFDRWDIADSTGWSIAHVAARHGVFLNSLAQLELADENGWTVAHVAVQYSHLPDNFVQWDLHSPSGWTVAHEAMMHEKLPDNFNRWGLPDGKGLPVLVYLFCGPTQNTFQNKFLMKWGTEKPSCKTEADWDVFKIALPEIYSKYTIAEVFDDSTVQDAHLL